MKIVTPEEERTSALLRLGGRGRAFLRLGPVVRGASRSWRAPRRGARISRGAGRGFARGQYRGQYQQFYTGGWRGRGAAGYVQQEFRGAHSLSVISFIVVGAVHELN